MVWRRELEVGVVIVVDVEEVASLEAAAIVNVRTKNVVVPGVRIFLDVLCKPCLGPSATRSPASEAATSGSFVTSTYYVPALSDQFVVCRQIRRTAQGRWSVGNTYINGRKIQK